MSAVLNIRPSWRNAGVEWLPVLIGVALLYVPTFYGLATTIWQEDDYAHGPIVLAVVIWLLWDRRASLLTPAARTAPVAGLLMLVFGLLLYTLGRSQGISLFEVGSLLPVLAGTLVAMRGWAALRAFWFMLFFTLYLVPLPGVFVDSVTGPLKQNVSAVSEHILYSAGYPIARSGVMLTIGHYQMLVADACSGINSMFSLTAVGLLYLYLKQHSRWLHNAIIVASLVPIAFCANMLRVMFLVLVTYHFGDAAGQGFLHGFSGMALFVVALLLVLLLDSILSRMFRPRNEVS
jgi:exosortase B